MRLGTLYAPGDEQHGAWPHERLLEMDAHFSAALEHAFELGLERRESAAGQVKLPASPGPRWAISLPREIQEGLWRSSAADTLVFVTR
jgi:hypothetical protein